LFDEVTSLDMIKYKLIYKCLVINMSSRDVANAIRNSFEVFESDIEYKFSSLDRNLYTFKLLDQAKFGVVELYATIIIDSVNQNHARTELEFLISYKSNESILNAWVQKRKIKGALDGFLLEFKRRCEKWL